MSKRIKISYEKERCLLSDVLPYEVPLTFTNRFFYNFVVNNKVNYSAEKITWLKKNNAHDVLMRLIFSLPDEPKRISSFERYIGKGKRKFVSYNIGKMEGAVPVDSFLIPFGYKINHKKYEFRELSIPHFRNQLQIVDFYDRCKETILYMCSKSNFSIRKPVSIAKYKVFKDLLHFKKLASEPSSVEEVGKEYENLKSFFVYKDYSNIFKFYESPKYHRCEKKYNKLIKLDISKCFDSIYTHSISWAIFGKDFLKENLSKDRESFPDSFDRLMQSMNYGETNGIIIGPEFSRIFSEIIIQSIDDELEKTLLSKVEPIGNKVDYEIFRYVDDYFVFYNDDHVKDEISEELQHILKKYKLYINSDKIEEFEKPIITEITIAKNKIASLLEGALSFKTEEEITETGETIKTGSISINSRKLITAFKSVIKESHVEYKDMLNYSLAILERKMTTIFQNYSELDENKRPEKGLSHAVIAILEFAFFIYSVAPKVNTTIKLCRLIRVVTEFYSNTSISPRNREPIHKLIFDEITFVLKKNQRREHTQIETLFLLTAMSQLGKEYWLNEKVLSGYLALDEEPQNKPDPNFFLISVALSYTGKKKSYEQLRSKLEVLVVNKIKAAGKTRIKNTEIVMLVIDLLACPFISQITKNEVLTLMEINVAQDRQDVINYFDVEKEPLSLSNWTSFNFGKELDAKSSQEVY